MSDGIHRVVVLALDGAIPFELGIPSRTTPAPPRCARGRWSGSTGRCP